MSVVAHAEPRMSSSWRVCLFPVASREGIGCLLSAFLFIVGNLGGEGRGGESRLRGGRGSHRTSPGMQIHSGTPRPFPFSCTDEGGFHAPQTRSWEAPITSTPGAAAMECRADTSPALPQDTSIHLFLRMNPAHPQRTTWPVSDVRCRRGRQGDWNRRTFHLGISTHSNAHQKLPST